MKDWVSYSRVLQLTPINWLQVATGAKNIYYLAGVVFLVRNPREAGHMIRFCTIWRSLHLNLSADNRTLNSAGNDHLKQILILCLSFRYLMHLPAQASLVTRINLYRNSSFLSECGFYIDSFWWLGPPTTCMPFYQQLLTLFCHW